MSYEYAVVPAPKKGLKAKGVKSNEDRFAYALTTTLNQYAQQGWEYMRTDTLPSEERSGVFGKTSVVHQNMLVFRRALAQPTAAVAPVAAPPTMADRVQPAAVAAPPRMMAVEPQPLTADPGRTEPRLGSD